MKAVTLGWQSFFAGKEKCVDCIIKNTIIKRHFWLEIFTSYIERQVEKVNDENIIELFFQRSESAIMELSQKYGKLSLKIAYDITRDYEDAEECVEDTYMAIWGLIPPERPDNLRSYVMKVLRNISINKYKHNRCKKRNDTYYECVEELEYCISGSVDVESEYEKSEVRRIIERYIDSLSKINKLIFLKRYWYMNSYDEISKLTGVTKTAVGHRLIRMRKNLRKFLKREGYDYEW